MSVGQNRCEWLGSAATGTVEHLRLELAELVLEVGEVVGQRLDDGRVPGADVGLVRGAQVLGSCNRGHL